MNGSRTPPSWIMLLFAALFYILVTVIITYPMVTQLGTHIAGSYSDNLYFAWQIGWIKKAIFEYHQNPLKTDLVNFPYGYSLLFTEISPLQILIALPFTFGGNAIFAFNISILATFVLAGLAMFAWAFHLTRSFLSALIIGFAYSFSAYHLSHYMVGHLNLCGIQWFPLYFWGLFAILNKDRHTRRNQLMCAAGLGAISLTALYYFYMTLVITAVIVFYQLITSIRKKSMDAQFLKPLANAVLMSMPAIIVGVGPYIIYHTRTGSNRSMLESLVYSASITDFVLPFTKQYLFGHRVWELVPRNLWIEGSLYLGLTILGFGIIAWLFNKDFSKDRLSAFLLIGFIASMIFAMGVAVVWKEEPLVASIPVLKQGEFTTRDAFIWLPSYLLYQYLPFYALMRVPMRYGIFTMFFICSAAAVGIGFLVKQAHKKIRLLLKIIILFIILLDFWITPISYSPIGPRAVDRWLAEQPKGGLVQLPFWQSLKQEHMFYTLYHGKPVISIMPTFPSERMRLLKDELDTFPDDESLDALKRENISYLLIDTHEISLSQTDSERLAAWGFTFAGEFDDQLVFTGQ